MDLPAGESVSETKVACRSGESIGVEALVRAECRICRDEEPTCKLLSPCLCSGSMEYIHYECLVQCIEFGNATVCDVCLGSFTHVETRTMQPTFGDFLETNPEFRTELIFAIFMALLMAASLICQFFKAPQERHCLWLQALVLGSFLLFYAYYMFHFYQEWLPDNMRVQVIKRVSK